MSVDGHGDRRAGVPEELAHLWDWDALGQGQGRRSVSQVMERQTGKAKRPSPHGESGRKMLIEVALGPTSLQPLLQPHLLPHSSTCQYSAVSPYEQNSVT